MFDIVQLSSVHELFEEAQRIASAVDDFSPKKIARKPVQNTDTTNKPTTVNGSNLPHTELSEDIKSKKSKRTVDEIIATLHDQSNA
jgi:hypothetical protein